MSRVVQPQAHVLSIVMMLHVVKLKEGSGEVANQIHCGELPSPPSAATNDGWEGVDR